MSGIVPISILPRSFDPSSCHHIHQYSHIYFTTILRSFFLPSHSPILPYIFYHDLSILLLAITFTNTPISILPRSFDPSSCHHTHQYSHIYFTTILRSFFLPSHSPILPYLFYHDPSILLLAITFTNTPISILSQSFDPSSCHHIHQYSHIYFITILRSFFLPSHSPILPYPFYHDPSILLLAITLTNTPISILPRSFDPSSCHHTHQYSHIYFTTILRSFFLPSHSPLLPYIFYHDPSILLLAITFTNTPISIPHQPSPPTFCTIKQ